MLNLKGKQPDKSSGYPVVSGHWKQCNSNNRQQINEYYFIHLIK